MADGAGATTEEGDVAGTTVGCGVLAGCCVVAGCGVLALGAGLVGVAADRDVEDAAPGEAVDCAGAAGEAVAACEGLNSPQVTRATRKTAVRIQVEVRTRRISRSRPVRRFPERSAG